jgi:hypothetical protein
MESTVISGYFVELEEDQCFVSFKDNYFASLTVLDATGALEDALGRPHRVPAATIARIQSWAIERGY